MIWELPHGPRKGESFEVSIERLGPKGVGVATMKAAIGPQPDLSKRERRTYTFHVRKAVPGDRVRVVVEGRKRKLLTARVDEILEPSRMRTTPKCAHFGFKNEPGKGCGGCVLQTLDYRHQLMVKEQGVKRFVQEAGLDPGLVWPVIGCDEPWYYRNKMEFSFGTEVKDGPITVGMHPSGYRYDVLGLTECWLESPGSEQLVREVQEWARRENLRPWAPREGAGFLSTFTVREGKRTDDRMVILTTTSAAVAQRSTGEELRPEDVAASFLELVQSSSVDVTSVYWVQHHARRGERTRMNEHHLWGEEVLREELRLPGDQTLRFEVSPSAFFQPNTLQAEVLYTEALEATGLRTDAASTVLDLYCGTGTIGLCMAPWAERVAGIELNASAVEDARANAARNGITSAKFWAGDVGEVLGSDDFAQGFGTPDVVVVDPPRAGLSSSARQRIMEVGAPRVVYVSCNPKTLARDLAELMEVGGYVCERIQPVDMFPHTYHIENVARLHKPG